MDLKEYHCQICDKLLCKGLLKIGEDVKALQVFLNTNGFILAPSGLGSRGNEVSTFGRLTVEVLKKFQKSVWLPATGFFGAMTRDYIKGNF